MASVNAELCGDTPTLLKNCNQPCGTPKNCECRDSIGVIYCKGFNVTEIPIFTEKETRSIVLLDISDTKIKDARLYPFWASLEIIYFTNNTLLECDIITQS